MFNCDFHHTIQASIAATGKVDIAKTDPNKMRVERRKLASAKCTSLTRFNQRKVGGPREGSGGAVRDAMCAALIGRSACESDEIFSKYAWGADGGTVMATHRGQSKLAEALKSELPSESTNFILPPDVQTICILPGLTMVEAIADPRNKANHTSTRRVMNLALRRDCMVGIMPNVDSLHHLTQMYSFEKTKTNEIAVLRWNLLHKTSRS